MRAGTPPLQPEGTRRCPPMTERFEAGRFILPALLCARWLSAGVQGRGSAAVLMLLMPVASAQEAGVWPAASERQQDAAVLRPAGVQKARALALFIKASRVLHER